MQQSNIDINEYHTESASWTLDKITQPIILQIHCSLISILLCCISGSRQHQLASNSKKLKGFFGSSWSSRAISRTQIEILLCCITHHSFSHLVGGRPVVSRFGFGRLLVMTRTLTLRKPAAPARLKLEKAQRLFRLELVITSNLPTRNLPRGLWIK
jgi:hypothetical protein